MEGGVSWKAFTDLAHGFAEGALLAILPFAVIGLLALGGVKQCAPKTLEAEESW